MGVTEISLPCSSPVNLWSHDDTASSDNGVVEVAGAQSRRERVSLSCIYNGDFYLQLELDRSRALSS
jgi:hypothetical protein